MTAAVFPQVSLPLILLLIPIGLAMAFGLTHREEPEHEDIYQETWTWPRKGLGR